MSNNFNRKKPLISIVIPSWFCASQDGMYGQDETFVMANICLKRLLEVTPREIDGKLNFELIIIDNGSTLNLPEVEEYFSKADILIKNKNNLGFGPAMNQGFALARGEYVAALNNDIILFNGWEKELLEIFDKKLDPPVGAVMPQLIKRQYQKDCLGENGKLDIYKVLELKKENIALRNKDIYEPHAQFGSAFIIKRKLLEELKEKEGHYYDEQFLCGFSEDRDLWDRIYLLGYETYRSNRLNVAHIGNLTIGKIEDRRQYTEVNREKLAEKRKLREENKL